MLGLSTTGSRPGLILMFAATLLAAVAGHDVIAQEKLPDNVAPPVVKAITKDERTQLDAASDVKERTKVALGLMEVRLARAESLYGQSSYGAVLEELGGFQILMTGQLAYLNRNNTGRGKVLDMFRRFEIALRAFAPRIETIRREVPDRYEFHVRRLLSDVRDVRARAVQPFFGDTVVPGATADNK